MVQTPCFDETGNELTDGDIVRVDKKDEVKIREYNDELYFTQQMMIVRVSNYDSEILTKL